MIFHFKAEGLSVSMGKIIPTILLKPAAEVGRFQKMSVIPSNLSDKKLMEENLHLEGPHLICGPTASIMSDFSRCNKRLTVFLSAPAHQAPMSAAAGGVQSWWDSNQT